MYLDIHYSGYYHTLEYPFSPSHFSCLLRQMYNSADPMALILCLFDGLLKKATNVANVRLHSLVESVAKKSHSCHQAVLVFRLLNIK